MTDELDKRFLDETALFRVWSHDVEHRVDGEFAGDSKRLQHLTYQGFTPEAGQTLVPDGTQQLLHVGMGNKLERLIEIG